MDPLLAAYLQSAIELPLLLFHVSVTMCILRQISKKNSAFANGFYALYVTQSVADITALVLVRNAVIC